MSLLCFGDPLNCLPLPPLGTTATAISHLSPRITGFGATVSEFITSLIWAVTSSWILALIRGTL